MGKIHRLSATKIASLKKPGYYSDGSNLYFRIADGGTRGWIFRYALNGRTRDMGLGPHPEVGLASARERAFDNRKLVADKIDPIATRNAQRASDRVDASRSISFEQCCTAYIAAHEASWRNAKHRAQWAATLATYVYPVFGKLPASAIDTGLVMRVLEPIWTTKPETATRVRGRIEAVLDWARVRGYRTGENPARWRGHLDHLLPAKSKIKRIEHFAAMSYEQLGPFVAALRQQPSIIARALEFLVLTAARTGEVVGATWDEIDLGTKTWTIPAARMKAHREHRVPLSPRALTILKAMQAARHCDYVFPGVKEGKPIHESSMLWMLGRMDCDGITAHGFRSTFRDWAAERTSFPREIAELALAHSVGSGVEQAYRRSDMFDKRRKLMDAWAEFCGRPAMGGKVVPISAKL
jgi:integrase